jgi:hypothetical protein
MPDTSVDGRDRALPATGALYLGDRFATGGVVKRGGKLVAGREP